MIPIRLDEAAEIRSIPIVASTTTMCVVEFNPGLG
jgi:hypothetical protein